MRKLLIHELLYRIMYSLSKEGYTEIDLKDLENFLIKASQKPVFKIMFENIEIEDNKIDFSSVKELLTLINRSKVIIKEDKEYLLIPDFLKDEIGSDALVDNLTEHYISSKKN